MSTRFESVNSERATRTAFPGNTPFTFGVYFYLHSLPAAGQYFPILTLYGNFVGFWVGVNSAGRLVIYDWNFNQYTVAAANTLSTGTWYYLWGRLSSAFSLMSLYLDGSTTAAVTSTGNVAIDQASMTLQFASNVAGGETAHANISTAYGRAWSVDRAASNANTEKASTTIVSTTSALGSWPFIGTDITDHHTTARHLTATGTLSAGPDSPIDGGSEDIEGTGTVTLPGLSISGAGALPVAGTGTVTLPSLSLSGTGEAPAAGTGTVTLPGLTVSGTGEAPAAGTGTVTLPGLSVSGTGEAPISGTGTVVLPALSVSGEGESDISGSGTVVLPALEVTGGDAGIRTGEGSITLPPLVVSGVGTSSVQGIGTVTLPALVLSGAGGTVDAELVGTVTLPALVLSGAGALTIRVAGTVVLPSLIVSAEGEVTIVGSGTLLLPGLVISGMESVPEVFRPRALAGVNRLWPHHLYIVRSASGTAGHFNEDDEWVEGENTPEVIYNWGADVQDQGRTIQRTTEGLPTLRSDAVAFLRDERKISDIRIGDPVVISWEDGSTEDAEVIRVVRMDGSLDLTRV